MKRLEDFKRTFKRRNKNNKEKVKFFLEFIKNDYIIYDNSIFLIHDIKLIDTLTSLGFIKEDFIIFDNSQFTMYWEKYNIEVELVTKEYWDLLDKSIKLCNLTEYFNINDIYNVISENNIIK